MTKNNIIMFAASQGGHFTELMGLKPLFDKYDSVLVTSNLNATKDREELKCFQHIEHSASMAKRRDDRAGNKVHSRWSALSAYMTTFGDCIRIYKRHKPVVVISTGSYIAVPLFIMAKLYGAKTIFIESNAKVYSKTATGKLVELFSDRIYVQWPEMLSVYKNAEFHGVIH